MREQRAVVERLLAAVNAHDLDEVVACFAPEYVNETPAHPGRGFTGCEQVRTNWERIFTGLRDLTAEVPRMTVDGDEVWTEWEMRGTRPDGTAQMLRGVIIFRVAGGSIAAARFYLEPVDAGEGGVDTAIGRVVDPRLGPAPVIRDARPPMAMIRMQNPLVRTLLRTPLGRTIRPWALLEFAGRKTGRRYRVPVGWYETAQGPVVFSPAAWRANFAGGADVMVFHRGRAARMRGRLVTDPDETATALREVLEHGTTARMVGLRVPDGHAITALDVEGVGRQLIRFEGI